VLIVCGTIGFVLGIPLGIGAGCLTYELLDQSLTRKRQEIERLEIQKEGLKEKCAVLQSGIESRKKQINDLRQTIKDQVNTLLL